MSSNLIGTVTETRPALARWIALKALIHATNAGDLTIDDAFSLATELGITGTWFAHAGDIRRMTGQIPPAPGRSVAGLTPQLRDRVRQHARPGESLSAATRRILADALDRADQEARDRDYPTPGMVPLIPAEDIAAAVAADVHHLTHPDRYPDGKHRGAPPPPGRHRQDDDAPQCSTPALHATGRCACTTWTWQPRDPESRAAWNAEGTATASPGPGPDWDDAS